MAIAPTGAIYKALSFDNTSSRNYGVYITGEAVYNAPEREVEMVSIPGRNGALALDKGRFENIEVTYPAGIFADTEANFAQAVSDFRNFLCSKKGYCRLSDDYNPSEYRMAVYKSGLEVSPAQLKAGEFDITFECQPQRFLTSGETKSTVANNGTLTNPTLFPSSPLLELVGYGAISLNNDTVSVIPDPYGTLLLANKKYRRDDPTYSCWTILNSGELSLMNTGDTITVNKGSTVIASVTSNVYPQEFTSFSVSRSGGSITGKASKTDNDTATVVCDSFSFLKGTSNTQSMELSVSFTLVAGGSTTNWSGTFYVNFAYNGDGLIEYGVTTSPALPSNIGDVAISLNSFVSPVYGNSTKSPSGTFYIDLDIGEAYKIENNEIISVNSIAFIPPDLPTLTPGSNTITFDNTITSLKITPRWWKV